MENPDFIEVYDNAIDAAACAGLIARFEASSKLSRGATGSGVNTALKDSWDIGISQHEEWRDAEGALNRAMLRGLMSYVRRHAFLAIAPMQLSRKDAATGTLVPLDGEAVTTMPDADLQALVMKVFRPGKINIQRYFADEGGYPYWHSELYPKQGGDETLHRVLLWTIYLNDAFEDGDLSPENVAKIAIALDVPESDVVNMNRRLAAPDHSLNAPLRADSEGEWQDWLVDDSESQETKLGDRQELGLRRDLLVKAMSHLNERERDILTHRRLREQPTTLEDLSQKYRISRERVRQIEVRAFEKLQKAIKSAALERRLVNS